MEVGFHRRKSTHMKINVARQWGKKSTERALTLSVCSHLEVSVYYTLLMAILHCWHNLESEKETDNMNKAKINMQEVSVFPLALISKEL